MFSRGMAQLKHPVFAAGLACGIVICLLVALIPTSGAWSQTVIATPLLPQSSPKLPQSNTPNTSAAHSNRLKTTSKPSWQNLTPAQKTSLKPLAAQWNTLRETQKRKWIAIAENYPSLAPIEQTKLHNRMTEWASLSQDQRAQARLNFAESKQLSPTQKATTWQAYQSLSAEEKKKLAIAVKPKPTRAAAATKPVSPQKLTAIPVTRHSPKQKPRIAAANTLLNRNTLLPRAPVPVASAPAHKNSTPTMSSE